MGDGVKVSIRCLTDGAHVLGLVMRASQVVELDGLGVDEVARLRVIEAAGDIKTDLPAVDAVKVIPLKDLGK